jgi:soluble lytic murein transglycosylase-like protein
MYLPVIESALRNVSYSSAGAAGIWQFMPATAERYGLLVNDSIDERLDFEKSTEAAIVYLQDLYERFGNRTLVAAAYNRGENGLQRDMARQDVDNFYDLWLNEETSRYIFRILATKEIMENRFQYFPVEVL